MDTQGRKRRIYSIKEYTLAELTHIYDMSKYRLKCRIEKHKKEIGERTGNFYETPQVVAIFKLIPLPSDVDII